MTLSSFLSTFPLITQPGFYAVAIPAVLLMGVSKSGFGAVSAPWPCP